MASALQGLASACEALGEAKSGRIMIPTLMPAVPGPDIYLHMQWSVASRWPLIVTALTAAQPAAAPTYMQHARCTIHNSPQVCGNLQLWPACPQSQFCSGLANSSPGFLVLCLSCKRCYWSMQTAIELFIAQPELPYTLTKCCL